MIVLVGESASGKSSIEKYFVDNYGYKKITSYTTRQPRNGEVDGKDYHFITEEQFKKLKKQGFFAHREAVLEVLEKVMYVLLLYLMSTQLKRL